MLGSMTWFHEQGDEDRATGHHSSMTALRFVWARVGYRAVLLDRTKRSLQHWAGLLERTTVKASTSCFV